jgi:AAA family ATP:ADP antiporter
MALFFFIAIASICLIKSVQTGLYLVNVGVDYKLPLIYIILALLSGPLVLLYRTLGKRFSLILLTSCTIIFLISNLMVFWWLLARGDQWVYIVFYFWGAVFAVLLPTQGWFFSYRIYAPRAARRVFALLGAGGILGGVAGSYYTFFAAGFVGEQGLLLHVVLALLALQIILMIVHNLNRRRLAMRRESAESEAQSKSPRALKSILRSSHFRTLAALVLAATLTSTLIDLLYKKALELTFVGSSAEELTQFYAVVLGTIYVFSAAFQLVGTTQILRKAGLGAGLLVLPLALSIGSISIIMATVVVATAFLAVVATKFLDDSLRRSVDRTSFELLYVPMPERQVITIKSIMELIVARVGDGLGAALFLGLITLAVDPVVPAAIAILFATGVWVFLTLKVKENYAQTLRRSLEFGKSRFTGRVVGLDEAVADNTLLGALESPNPEKVQFALERLIEGNDRKNEGEMDIGDISAEAFDMDVTGIYRTAPQAPRWLKKVESLTEHSDNRVAAAAFQLMILHEAEKYGRILREALSAVECPDRHILVYLETYEEDPKPLLDPERVVHWSETASDEESVLLARIIGKTKSENFLPILDKWLKSDSRALQNATFRALGNHANTEYVPILLDHLIHNWSRRAASQALINYGETIVPELIRLLRDPQVSLSIKREVPYVLTRINTRSSRAGLVASLYTYDSVVSYRALKGLNAIRDDAEELSYSQESFIPLLQMWAKEFFELINIETLAHNERRALSPLMRRVLEERKDWTVEKIFRGLELYLPMGDAYMSYIGFKSDDPELREHAVELIDTRIRGELRQTLLPIFADAPQRDIAIEGQMIFQLPSNLEDALSEALFGGDPWFKCTIVAELARQKTQNWKERVKQALEDISPMVQETARWALEKADP